ncbi:MAG: UDP-glucose 4-epimerase GalE [Fibromonadales bacterium]|nr:UDP-glucose 4-epimerase GalE [Fibromonadales bacterium]
MNTILIPGGAGYIGSHTVRALAEAGFDCVIYDNLSEGHREAVKDFELIEGDLLDYEKLSQVFKNRKIIGVVHFAAFALVGISMKEPLDYYRNNVIGTHNLLTAMRNAEVKNIVFSSTCATYGNVKTTPINESFITEPCNPYGETKLAVEKMLKWCDTAYGMRYVCPRYFNAAGAMPDGSIGEDHKLETHLIPLVYRTILKDETVSVFGNDYPTRDGSCIRDYIHVCDLADAHVRALKYLISDGSSMSVNLGTEHGASVFEIIKAAEQASGKTVKYAVAQRRAGDPPILVADASLAKEKLGWSAVRGLTEIMNDAWQWHKNHPNGYEPYE